MTADIQAPTTLRVPFSDLAAQTTEVRSKLDIAWTQVVDSGRFVGGSIVERFEQEWAAYRHRLNAAHPAGIGKSAEPGCTNLTEKPQLSSLGDGTRRETLA